MSWNASARNIPRVAFDAAIDALAPVPNSLDDLAQAQFELSKKVVKELVAGVQADNLYVSIVGYAHPADQPAERGVGDMISVLLSKEHG